jgi:CRP/FNR family cyclic AMP-dependent transcriptional regulator
MPSVLEVLRGYPVRSYAVGEAVLTQGDRTGLLYVLVSGSVVVMKDDVEVARVSDPGAIFGDLSALLDVPHTASVCALRESAFHVVAEPRTFLNQHPAVCLQLCQLLARRLDSLNKYLGRREAAVRGRRPLGHGGRRAGYPDAPAAAETRPAQAVNPRR